LLVLTLRPEAKRQRWGRFFGPLSPVVVWVNPNVRCGLPLVRKLDHVHRR
jgi:hypothetical protein